MAGSALLEKEIEKIIAEKQQELQKDSVGYEEERHYDNRPSDPYNILDRHENLYNYAGKAAELERSSAWNQSFDEPHEPVVPNFAGAPSAVDRFADIKRAQSLLADMHQRSNEIYGQAPVEIYDYADSPVDYEEPVEEAPYMNGFDPAYMQGLYEQGVLTEPYISPAIEHIDAPTYSPSYVPMNEPSFPAEDDDALPTRKTLDTIRRDEVEDEIEESTFFSALSSKTKIVLAAVCATIVLLLTIICINTAILKGINSDVAFRENRLADMQATYGQIQSDIADITSPENLERWASELDNPMTPPADWNN